MSEADKTLVAPVGAWFIQKWRQRAAESGVGAAARQMRKQGVPLEVALYTLAWSFK